MIKRLICPLSPKTLINLISLSRLADVFLPSSELIRVWLQSVDIPTFSCLLSGSMYIWPLMATRCHGYYIPESIVCSAEFKIFCIFQYILLTHWGRVTHICVSDLIIIGSENGLSPSRRQAIIWTNDGILLIGSLGTNFSEILSEIHTFSFKKMHLKMSSGKCRPFCLGLNVLTIVLCMNSPRHPH